MKQFLFLTLAVLSQTSAEQLNGKQLDISPDICESKPNWSLIPHPSDCERFYLCANRVLEEYTCIENYHFDQELQRCVRGSCSSKIEATECPNWVRRFRGNCHLYEVCHNNIGNYSLETCPKGSYFLESLGACLPIPPNEDTPQYICSCIVQSYMVIKNPDDCGSFYMCIDGKAELQSCGPEDFFNEFLNACVQDLNGVCKYRPEVTQEMLDICSNHTNQTEETPYPLLYPDNRSCTRFFMCLDVGLLLKSCPQGFYFNRESRTCESDRTGRFCRKIQAELNKMLEEKKLKAFIKLVLSQNTKKIRAIGWNVTNNKNSKENQSKTLKVPVPPIVISNNYSYQRKSIKSSEDNIDIVRN